MLSRSCPFGRGHICPGRACFPCPTTFLLPGQLALHIPEPCSRRNKPFSAFPIPTHRSIWMPTAEGHPEGGSSLGNLEPLGGSLGKLKASVRALGSDVPGSWKPPATSTHSTRQKGGRGCTAYGTHSLDVTFQVILYSFVLFLLQPSIGI